MEKLQTCKQMHGTVKTQDNFKTKVQDSQVIKNVSLPY